MNESVLERAETGSRRVSTYYIGVHLNVRGDNASQPMSHDVYVTFL